MVLVPNDFSLFGVCIQIVKGTFITVIIDDFMFELMVISKRC